MIEFGREYRDKFTGFTGTATARTEFSDGHTKVCLETLGGDNILEYWFEEARLEPAGAPKAPGFVA